MDFDKCQPRGGDGWKTRNLQRLQRSLHKELRQLAVFHWQERDWLFLESGYAAGSAPG